MEPAGGVVARLTAFFLAVMLYFLLRALLVLVLFFWTVLMAIIVVWTGYRLLYERSKKAKNEASPRGEWL